MARRRTLAATSWPQDHRWWNTAAAVAAVAAVVAQPVSCAATVEAAACAAADAESAARSRTAGRCADDHHSVRIELDYAGGGESGAVADSVPIAIRSLADGGDCRFGMECVAAVGRADGAVDFAADAAARTAAGTAAGGADRVASWARWSWRAWAHVQFRRSALSV